MSNEEKADKYMIQLYILPFAGGNSTSFARMASCIDSKTAVVPIEYSGRGRRLHEGYITNYQDFLMDVVEQIQKTKIPEAPYALFGYSMGAALAYEIAASGYLNGTLKHIFYAARACIRDERPSVMTEEAFFEHAKQLGGFQEEVVRNKRLMNLFVHPLQDDYRIASQYCFRQGPQELQCDTTIFYSENDTPLTTVKAWAELTNGKTQFCELGDNHFFVREHYRKMASRINEALQA